MRHTETSPPSPPRYVRATLATAAAVAFVPVLFFLSAYADYRSPEWDPTDDSGAVQGFFFIGISSVLAVTFAVFAFPAAGKLLHRRGTLSCYRFFRLLTLWLAGLSFLLGLAVAGMLCSFAMFVPLGFVVFTIASLCALPFAALWFKLSQ